MLCIICWLSTIIEFKNKKYSKVEARVFCRGLCIQTTIKTSLEYFGLQVTILVVRSDAKSRLDGAKGHFDQ